MQKLTAFLACVCTLALAGCGGRTSPATQPVPASYDPSKNDPKAVEIANQMATALGGADKWGTVKQIQWNVEVTLKGEIAGLYKHSWDRWNARHRFENTSIQSYKKAQETGDDDEIETTVVMYRLFERERSHAKHDGNELSADDRKRATDNAFQRWGADSYLLTLGFRLTDPGVYVEHSGETSDEYCKDGCDVIKVTFDPAVGQDKYWINVNKKTHLPEMVELELAGKSGRIAYQLSDWQEVGGLKFPGKLDNIGARNMGDTEVWLFTNITIGEPDDELYIPRVY